MIYSLFFLYRILGQQLLFKGKHRDVNCAKFTVTYIENFASKVWSVRSLGRKKKGSRLRLCFRVVDDLPEKKRMDLWKQMSSSRWSFTCICEIFFALKPFHDYNLCSFCILPQPAFYSQSAVCSLHLPLVRSLHSAVRSPQSAVCSLQSPVRSPQSALRSPQSSSYTDRCFIDS